MAKFPVESDDNVGVVEALNYLLSGPTGLGQNFAGFSSYTPGYLTGNFRIPFSQSTPAILYVPDIALSNAEQIDDRTIKYTFAATQSSPPFSSGMGIYVTGVTPASYNTSGPGSLKANGYQPYQIGVVECTVDYVIIRTGSRIIQPLGTYVSGGLTSYSSTGDFTNSTDCNARCTVTGGTDRVFISGQLDNLISYTLPEGGTGTFYYTVSIERWVGSINNDPVNPDYVFDYEETVALKSYTFTGLTGSGTLPLQETVFTSILDAPLRRNKLIDAPKGGYYWYIMQVQFNYDGDLAWIEATESEMLLRSISVQVVKQ